MGNYKLITTEDGSETLYDPNYDQTMHSMSGAWDESIKKHIIPSKILQLQQKNITVLDVGFGLGYNISALLHQNRILKLNKQFTIISLEKNRDFQNFLNSIKFNDDRQIEYKKIIELFNNGFYQDESCSIKLLFGDARENIKRINNIKFDAIFYDPFSPGKNPEMWSLDIFRIIVNLIKTTGILTTYSSALQIRRAMFDNGFILGRGPSVGKKRDGTVASLELSQLDNPLSTDDLHHILNDIKSTPYKDPMFNSPKEEILQNRINRMAKFRDELKEKS